MTEVTNYRPLNDLIPAHWEAKTVTANGIEQHYYRTGGRKPPLVMLHGITSGALYWLRVAKALEADYDVIMPDARGHGRSARVHNGQLAFENLVADAVALIRALELDRPYLLGHSMGGITATFVAANYPELLGGLMIVDATWSKSDAQKDWQKAFDNPGYKAWLDTYVAYLEALKTQSHTEKMAAAQHQRMPNLVPMTEEDYVAWVEMQAQLDVSLMRHGLSLWTMLNNLTPQSELVQKISCPILLITGGRSHGDPQAIQEVTAALPAGRHIVLENAGHMVNVDAFDGFVEAIKTFLKGI
jgi:N-formylmaleamate deformylase